MDSSPPPSRSPSPASGITVGRTDTGDGNPQPPAIGVDDVVTSAFVNLPSGLIGWTYPALVTAVPGLLLLFAVAAQTLGALAWIPVVRRGLAGVGIDRRRRPRLR